MPDEYESCMSLVEIYKNNNMVEKAIEILEGSINYLIKQNITPDPRILAEKAQIHLQLHQDSEFINCMNWMLKEEYLIANRDITPFTRKRKHKDFDIYDVDTENSDPENHNSSQNRSSSHPQPSSSISSPPSSGPKRRSHHHHSPSSSTSTSRKQTRQHLSFDYSSEDWDDDGNGESDDDELEIDDDSFPPPPVMRRSSSLSQRDTTDQNGMDLHATNDVSAADDQERVLDFKIKKKKKRIKDDSPPAPPGVLELLSEERFHSLVVTVRIYQLAR
jgi:hypothetical protein